LENLERENKKARMEPRFVWIRTAGETSARGNYRPGPSWTWRLNEPAVVRGVITRLPFSPLLDVEACDSSGLPRNRRCANKEVFRAPHAQLARQRLPGAKKARHAAGLQM